MRLAVGLICLAPVLVAPAARAVPVTFTWEGTVRSFFEGGTGISMRMGDPVSGSFRFESETPLSNIGYQGAILAWEVRFGGHVVEIFPSDDDPFGYNNIDVENGPPGRDFYLADLYAGPSHARLDGALLDDHDVWSSVELRDPDGLVLTSTDLPNEPPFTDFRSTQAFLWFGSYDGERWLNLQTSVDEIVVSTAVPEPGAWLLFAAGLVALPLAWRQSPNRGILLRRGESP